MTPMDRRMFLGAMIATTVLGVQACAAQDPKASSPKGSPDPSVATPDKLEVAPEPTQEPIPIPEPEPAPVPQFDAPYGPLWSLPPEVGNHFAWTVDDGASPDVVMAYANFAAQTGSRITFFVNGMYADSWAPAAAVLAPLIASGQVQIASHTFGHPSLTEASDAQIQDELMRNHEFIAQTFGVDARPWYRPPYGNRNERTDAAAAAVGYTVPVMWNGSIGDSGQIAHAILLQEADRWIQPASIVLGHANAPTVTDLFGHLTELIGNRGLRSVTLNDVFRPAAA